MPFPIGAIFSEDPAGKYQQSRMRGQKIEEGDLANEVSTGFGKSLSELYNAIIPGASPMPGAQGAGGGPQGASPMGQQGGPGMAGPGMPPNQAGGAPMGAPPGSGMFPGAGAGGRPPGMQPPGGAQPQMQPQQRLPGSPGAGGQQPGGGGGPLSLQQVVGVTMKALGPKADPRVLAGVIDRYQPIMNQQSQQQWHMLRQELLAQQTQVRKEALDVSRERTGIAREESERKREGGQESRALRSRGLDIAEKRLTAQIEQANQRIAQQGKSLQEAIRKGDISAARAAVGALRAEAQNIIGAVKDMGGDQAAAEKQLAAINQKIAEAEKRINELAKSGGASKASKGQTPGAPSFDERFGGGGVYGQ